MSTNSDKYTLQPVSHTHTYTSTLKRCSVGVFDSLVPGSSCFLAVSEYVIFSDRTYAVLWASEVSFNPVVKEKILPALPHLVSWILTVPHGYECQIWYIHFTAHHIRLCGKGGGVSGRCRLACGRPAAVAVAEKQVSTVWLHECKQELRHSRMNSSPLI